LITGAPVINFNGVFLVNSLEMGTALVGEERVEAARIVMRQTLNYPILVLGELAAEMRAYCACASQQGMARIEAYALCYLARDLQGGSLVSVASRIAWYAPALDRACVTQGQSTHQQVGGVFAVFKESYPLGN